MSQACLKGQGNRRQDPAAKFRHGSVALSATSAADLITGGVRMKRAGGGAAVWSVRPTLGYCA